MLYSIIRFITFIAIFGLLAFAMYWLNGLNGDVMIHFGDKVISVSILVAVLTIAGIVFAFWLLWNIVNFGVALIGILMGDKKAISHFFSRRAQKKGMNALSNSVEATAAGNHKQALAQAYKADKYLDNPALTGLILAQSAQAAGKPKEAEEAYKRVLASGQGRFAAIRGLMKNRLESGDKATALKLAEKAYALQSNDLETVNTLFELQVDEKAWEGARKTLKQKAKLEKLPADFITRREAVMALCEAKGIDQAVDKQRYGERVMLAHRLAPNLVPASLLAAKLKVDEGNQKAADAILVKSWNLQPHPEIAKLYAELQKDETAEERLQRFKALTKRQKDNPETRMLEAELLIATKDFAGARRALGHFETLGETARALSIMAAIEHGEGADEAIVRAYLARAAKASRGAQWVCVNCGHVHAEWVSDCVECESFDTLDWKRPSEITEEQESGLGVLLPLLEAKPQEALNVQNSETGAP